MASNDLLLAVALLVFIGWAITDIIYKLELIKKLKVQASRNNRRDTEN